MKSIIIYYSLDGNVKLLSETMAQEIGADILPLQLKRAIKTGTFMKYFWGGRQVIMKSTPELEALTLNPNDYDLIIIGTPVWASNYTPAIRSFLLNNQLSHKKIALFCSHESVPGKTLINLQAELADNQIISTIDFFAPLKHNQALALDEAKVWAKSLV
ncbi:MAG: flavodoxin [Candidatus Falkowbacteria bacterium]